ncbi:MULTISPECIES: PAS domain S-box protein [unclassified Rhizobium]|jgi:PAS domain S-box-containing protein|uniref:PAS domain-containing sensor histidine kinase n=1 Tax=unclassified Rhizobium TaxID=2613769 RepID=UPI000DD9DFC2|nr:MULTISPECIES: PAS domain S-box protein [unclassified Rhizobium]MBB3447141.1 PAS domain S-box-containing protein [Rhizobium sp. BK379]MBB3565670.1 PAS domain S-box-containing protein [Rhizobium sp. BK512]
MIERGLWDDSILGPPSEWPACLKATVDIMLPSHAQIVMFWGDQYVALYNDAYAPTIGLRHPRAFGRPAKENWSELWDDLQPLLDRVLHGGETVSASDRQFYIERHGHPETVYFDISYSPIKDETGSVRGVFCIVSETTERVRSQQALKESEERLRALFSQSAAGIGQTDLAGRMTLANQRFCEMLGYQRAELVGIRFQDLTFADDRPEAERLFQYLIETGEPFDMEKRCLRKDGSVLWTAVSVSALKGEDGSILQVGFIAIDISARKSAQEAERLLASIIASSNDAILAIDLNMTITNWNAAAERLYGYSREEAVGKSVLMLVPEERRDEEPEILRKVSDGKIVEPYETQRRRKDGSLVDVQLSVSPIYDSTGNTIGASKMSQDITARKEAERLQKVLTSELNHRVKNAFATVIAIARQTLDRNETGRDQVTAFHDRLMSMAKAHDLLTHRDWQRADLGELVSQVLEPYPPERFEIGGCAVLLPQKAVVSFSLAIHELATNAAKYGALSVAQGKVAISWDYEEQIGRLRFKWVERGGPAVTPPTRKGFGSRLVERLLAAELNGRSTISYNPTGVICEIDAILDPDGWLGRPGSDR